MTAATDMGFNGMEVCAYPCTQAIPLTEPGGPVNVYEALRLVFRRSPEKELSCWLQEHRTFIAQEGLAEPGFAVRSISAPRCFSLPEQPSDRVFVDLIFQVMLDDGQLRQVDFCARYQLDLRPCGGRCIGPLIYAIPGDYRARIGHGRIQGNEWLLPVMSRNDYDKAAASLLRTWMPESLELRAPVNGDALATAMGLRITRVMLPPDRDEQALLLAFPADIVVEENGHAQPVRFPAGTVLINVRRCRSPLEQRLAILHECAHRYLDRLYFLLQHTCRMHPIPSSPRGRTFDWMEYQAERMTYHLAMPAGAVLPTVHALLGEALPAKPAQLRRCILALSGIWKVTPTMARLRLIALGRQEAQGVMVSVDGKPVPDHGCEGAWPQGQTFTIPIAEARRLMLKSPAFRKAIQSGRYIWSEGHFCLREGVTRNGCLTDEARNRMEHYCLRFQVSGGGCKGEAACASAAKRRSDVYRSRYEFTAEPGSDEDEAQLEAFIAGAARWQSLAHSLPPSFDAALETIMHTLGISQQRLADLLGTDRNVVKRMLKPGARVTLRHMTAICVAMDIPYRIAELLMQRNGVFPTPCDEDSLLSQMLHNTDTLTIPLCNDILLKCGHAPLIAAPRAQRCGLYS